jgi:hypothetical protein
MEEVKIKRIMPVDLASVTIEDKDKNEKIYTVGMCPNGQVVIVEGVHVLEIDDNSKQEYKDLREAMTSYLRRLSLSI